MGWDNMISMQLFLDSSLCHSRMTCRVIRSDILLPVCVMETIFLASHCATSSTMKNIFSVVILVLVCVACTTSVKHASEMYQDPVTFTYCPSESERSEQVLDRRIDAQPPCAACTYPTYPQRISVELAEPTVYYYACPDSTYGTEFLGSDDDAFV